MGVGVVTTFSSSAHLLVVDQQPLRLLHVQDLMSDNTSLVPALVLVLVLDFGLLAAVAVPAFEIVVAVVAAGHAEPIVHHRYNRSTIPRLGLDHIRSHRLPVRIVQTYCAPHPQFGCTRRTRMYRSRWMELGIGIDVVERVMTSTHHMVNVRMGARYSHQFVHKHTAIDLLRQS